MPGRWSIEELKKVGHILMGAALADGERHREEVATILRILAERLGKPLPDDLRQHVKSFDPKSFDLEATCAGLQLCTTDQRRDLLQLVARVTEADSVNDLEESDYIRHLASVVGAAREDYTGLTFEVQYEDDEPSVIPDEETH